MLWKTVVAHWKVIIFSLMFVWVVIAGKVANTYHDKYLQADKDLKLSKQTINDMQTRQRDVATLDAKYTQELSDAQETINQLERDVATGKRRLQLNATCSEGGKSKSGGMGNDATARLTEDAERNYWGLRNGISAITNQVTYLQDYINKVCLK